MRNLKRMKMTQNGFFGDTFSDGFGGFKTMKKRGLQVNKTRNSHILHMYYLILGLP